VNSGYDLMLSEILSQGETLAGKGDEMKRKVSSLADEFDPMTLHRLVLTGCGDSHYAGLGTRLAFEKLAGIPTEAVESQELALYLVDYLPSGTWVVGVSESGQPQSTNQALVAARDHDLTAIAVTSVAGSPICEAADACLDLASRRSGHVPGTYSYLASVVGLLLLAVELGERRAHISRAEAGCWRTKISEELEQLKASAVAMLALARNYVQNAGNDGPIYILGAGPLYATALFAAAKLFEASAVLSIPVQLEEWGHEQALLTQPGDRVVMLASNDGAAERIGPTVECVRSLGGIPLVIGPEVNASSEEACLMWRMDAPSHQVLSAIPYAVPAGLLAYVTAESMGAWPFAADRPERLAAIKKLLWIRPEA